jgi:hypothetical protein
VGGREGINECRRELEKKLQKTYKNNFPNQLMKKWLSVFILLASISFVSAQNNLGDLLNQIDQTTLILYVVFIVSFAILFFALSKFFKDNRSIAGLISAGIALLITYAVNKTGLDIQGFVLNIGISQETLAVVIPIILIAGIIFLIISLKKNSLFVIGGILILASFFVYEQTLLIAVGAILIIIRLFLGFKKKDFKNRGAGI